MTEPGTETEPERVLVVDDDPEIRDILGERLQLEGYEAELVGSAEEALASYFESLASLKPFKVLTVDIKMEPLGGPDLLRLIRHLDQEVTILMISGTDELSEAVHALRQGADEYLSKPIKIWDIRDRITTAIGRRRALARRRDPPDQHGLSWGGSIVPSIDEELEDPATEPLRMEDRRTGTAEEEDPALRGGPEGDEEAGERGCPDPRDGEVTHAGSPLDALLFVARRLEASHGLVSHGDLVARLVSRLGALLAGKLGLRPEELEALNLAARLHCLGLIREAGRLYWTSEDLDDSAGGPGDATEIPRRDEPGLVRGILEAISHRSFRVNPELVTWTIEVLRAAECARQRPASQPESSLDPHKLAVLGSLFEVADLWQHLLVELDPEEALLELRKDLGGQPAGSGILGDAIEALIRLEKLETR